MRPSDPPRHETLPRGLLCLLLLLGACHDGPHEIRDVREQRRQGVASVPAASLIERMGLSASSGSERAIEHVVPEGWTKVGSRTLRDLDFRAGPDREVECYLTLLPGSHAGFRAHANRWRRRMGAPEISEAELTALPPATLLGGEGVLISLETGPDDDPRGLHGIIARTEDGEASLLMAGPARQVENERPRFARLAASLRWSAPQEEDAVSASMRPAGLLQWTVPSGWRRLEDRPLREVTLAPLEGDGTECAVFTLEGMGGGIPLNLDRWREQMGLPPLGEAIDDLERIEVLGTPVPLLEIAGAYAAGPEGARPGQAMLAVAWTSGERSVFVKMVGPEEVVRRERPRFVAFCRSLKAREAR